LLEEERLNIHYSRKKKQIFDPTVEGTTKFSSKVLQTFLKPDEELSTLIPNYEVKRGSQYDKMID